MLDMVSRLSDARILVVDDDVFTQHVIQSVLNKSGYKNIFLANDGVEGIAKTSELKPDLVILDIHMPKLDGFGYCEHVRNDGELMRMPIIVQTASEEREIKIRALSCGADDFVTKPIDVDELVLRACLHLERFFMLRDIQDMCSYLRMEVAQLHTLSDLAKTTQMPLQLAKTLERHREVLETMVTLPALRA